MAGREPRQRLVPIIGGFEVEINTPDRDGLAVEREGRHKSPRCGVTSVRFPRQEGDFDLLTITD